MDSWILWSFPLRLNNQGWLVRRSQEKIMIKFPLLLSIKYDFFFFLRKHQEMSKLVNFCNVKHSFIL